MARVGPAWWRVGRRMGAAHPVLVPAVRSVGLPEGWRPRWRDVPRLAWVTARAFGGYRPGWFADVWAVPSAVVVQLPLLASAVAGGRVAAARDRSAVVVVSTGPAQTAAAVVTLAGWLAAGAGADYVSAGLLLAHAGTQAQAYTLGLGDLLAWLVFLVPAGVDAACSLRTWRAIDAGQAARHAAVLRAAGHTAWAVGPWAAWPARHGHGTALIDELLPALPPHVWLVAVAATPGVAALLDARGFHTPHPGTLLRVRPATAAPPSR
jgi:hypothetical protein